MVRWVVGSIIHGGPIELFLVPASVPAVVCAILSVVCAILLLLIGKSNPCGGSVFSLSLSEGSFTIYPTHVLSASLNKTFPSFLYNKQDKYTASRSGQVRSDGITSTSRTSCCSARLSGTGYSERRHCNYIVLAALSP